MAAQAIAALIRPMPATGAVDPLSFSVHRSSVSCSHLSLSRVRLPPSSRFVAVVKRSPKRLKYSPQPFKRADDTNMLRVKVDPYGDELWKLEPVIELLKAGAVGIIPTDTVYAIVCSLNNNESIERLRRIKGIGYTKPLSILCHTLREINVYTTGFPHGNSQGQVDIFPLVKHIIPGPYTFILPATKELPKQCIRHGSTTKYTARKQVGIRFPDDVICQTILQNLDEPLISTSVKVPSEDEWLVDPVLIADIYEPEGLDFIVDGGVRVAEPSTVVDMTGSHPTIIRQGKGPKQYWMVAAGDASVTGDELP